MIPRPFYVTLWDELSAEKQMVFLSGPRQVGKTTLVRQIAKSFKNNVYVNWDVPDHKKQILKDPAFFERANRHDGSMPLVIYDEIHKYKKWKNYLKGIYDAYSKDYKFLVSGSGRLDLYQKGGDSLAGRYFQFHLFPFTVSELSGKQRRFNEFIKNPLGGFDFNSKNTTREIWQALFNMGGFPEPFHNGGKAFYNRWIRNYTSQLVREDIRDISGIKNIDTVETLYLLLPSKVANLLSLNNLAEELQTAHGSIKAWLRLFDIFYLAFRVSPWTKKVSRAILKEQKLYLFHYPEIEDEGARFENMAALELLRAVYGWNERGYGRFSLHFVRNKQKEEVDFLIADRNTPVLLIETKLSDEFPAKPLIKFQNILNVPAVQLVNKDGVFKYVKNGKNTVLIITAHNWLSLLP